MNLRVRSLIFPVLAGWLLPTLAWAQGEQRSLEDRLLRPDIHRRQPIEIRNFQDPRQMTIREFTGSRSFQTATASTFTGQRYETPRFLGLKIPFLPKRPVTPSYADAARALPVEMNRLGQTAASEQNQPYADADRRSGASQRALPVRRATVEGTNQRNLSSEQRMSTEEVRALLNKPL